jgi:hypothetical protein
VRFQFPIGNKFLHPGIEEKLPEYNGKKLISGCLEWVG